MTYSGDAQQNAAWVEWLGGEADRLQDALQGTVEDNEAMAARLLALEDEVTQQRALLLRKDSRIASLRRRLDACLDESPPPPVEPPPATMLVGSSLYREPGETLQDSFNRRVSNWGVEPEAVRYFDSDWKLDSWPVFGSARVYASFKGEPAAVLSGQYDAHYRDLFSKAPSDRDVYWTYYHEPENDSFTGDQFRRAFDHIATIEDQVGGDRIFRGPILMNWSLMPGSKRNYVDWVPSAKIDFIGWDCYPGLDAADIRAKYKASVDATLAVGVNQWALMETAPNRSINPTDEQKQAWVPLAAGIARELGFMSWCYYDAIHDGNDYRLTTEGQWAAISAEVRK